ncbi:retrovirus-related Pol polyprotein from transposon 412 [Trichonephila clavipes]|nr:retrovirus-related Pol polyprotein from transposon 412 [Trichonephila clavipes]
MFINETVWIRTPLEETAVCLPMAEIELDCVFGHVITKAAVLRDSLDQGKYLLGNKTAALFEEVKKNKEIQVYMVNAVETRSQKKLTEESKQDLNMSEETIPESNEKNKESPDDELDDILPLIQPEISESNLIKLSHKDFAKEQMNSAELKTLFEEAKSGSSKKNHYIVKNNLLFFQKKIRMALKIFSRMGFPRELQTDQGTSFMSALTTEFLERFEVKVVRSSVYHPQTLFALRTVIHDSTGFSPAELVHGKNLRTPVMLLYEKLTEEEHVESSVVDYVFELINRMKRCQELAILHMEDSKQKQKLWYDRRTVKRQFQLGELVLVIAPSRPNKLSVQWVGPGEIVQQLSETNYVVKFPEKDKTHVYHVNMLKPYHQREENINLLCINPLKHDEEEDIPSLELENERSGWSKILSDVQLNSKLSQIQRGQLKGLLYEYSNLFFFRIFLDVPI